MGMLLSAGSDGKKWEIACSFDPKISFEGAGVGMGVGVDGVEGGQRRSQVCLVWKISERVCALGCSARADELGATAR